MARRARRLAGEQRRQLDVLKRGQLIDQVKRLEHEPHRVTPQPRQPGLRHAVDLLASQPDAARGRTLQPAEQIQQRRLAAPARTHDRHRLAGRDLEADLIDRAHQGFAAAVVLAQAAGAQRPTHSVPSSLPHRVPVPGARLEPPQIRLQPQHHAFQQQRRHRSVGLRQRGTLRLSQLEQQLPPLQIHDPDRVAKPAAAAATSFR